jgi:hypothetical protein
MNIPTIDPAVHSKWEAIEKAEGKCKLARDAVNKSSDDFRGLGHDNGQSFILLHEKLLQRRCVPLIYSSIYICEGHRLTIIN